MDELDFRDHFVTLSREVAGENDLVALCLYGSHAGGYARSRSNYDLLLVSDNYEKGVRYHHRAMDGKYAALLAVDKELLELDIERGALGDFVAGRLLGPYEAILNREYLRELEIKLKKRIILEEIRDLVIDYGELARGLLISPEYFPLSRMKRRALVYPPLRYSYLNLLRRDIRESNMKTIVSGFSDALAELVEAGYLKNEDGFVTITNDHLDKLMERKVLERVVNIMEQSRRAINSYLTHGRAGQISPEMLARELASKIIRQSTMLGGELEDPKRQLYLKTSSGKVRLSERATITEVASKLRPGSSITVSPLAGALNEVYLVSTGEDRLVAKKFTDWHGFKWFSLNLAALGTKFFAVSGKARLANEYGINRLLAEKRIPVPDIIHLSVPDRLLFEEYVDGEQVVQWVKKKVKRDDLSKEEASLPYQLGRTIATIHSHDVTLGDTKPENFVFKDGKVYTLDLEQARKGGDEAWDLAEFLYFTGHYCTRMTGGLHKFCKEFIRGYRDVAGTSSLKKAAGLTYVKVFSFWTPPQVIYGITRALSAADVS